jgi:hypothetical protein
MHIIKKIAYTTVIALLFMSFRCSPKECREGGHDQITFVNNSSMDISVQLIELGEDTLFHCNRIIPVRVLADSSFCFGAAFSCWEAHFLDEPYIQFFVLDRNIYKSVSCDSIRQYNMILHRYQLTFDDLEAMNWTVAYPPEGAEK